MTHAGYYDRSSCTVNTLDGRAVQGAGRYLAGGFAPWVRAPQLSPFISIVMVRGRGGIEEGEEEVVSSIPGGAGFPASIL